MSERIRALEERVGQPVMVRKSPLRPTALRERLLNFLYQCNLLERSAVEGLEKAGMSSDEPVALPIAVNFDSLATWFPAATSVFFKKHNLRREILAADQALTVEFLSQGKVLACVTSERLAPNGCQSTFLGTMIYRAVASPEFHRKYLGHSKDSEKLLAAPAIVYGWDDKLHDKYLQKQIRGKFNLLRYGYIPQIMAMKEWVLSGAAYAPMPERLIQDELRRGLLKEIPTESPLPVKLYWQTAGVVTSWLDELTATLKKFCAEEF